MDSMVDDESDVNTESEDVSSDALAHKTVSRNASPASTTGPIIRTANGQTVVLTSVPTSNAVKHATVSQALAVQQPGGGLSIVQLQIPSNQQNVVQSVIQPSNQQSVIQATGGAATVQTVQLPKGNVILLNKVGQGSVIQSTDCDSAVHHGVQIISRTEDGETITPVIFEDDSRKRREILARRPSYRKILNDLSSTEGATAVTTIPAEIKTEDDDRDGTATITVAGGQYLKVLPASAIQLAGSQDGTLQGIQTLTMTNAGTGTAGTIVQYATQGQDGQFYVPVTVSAADLQAYQIRTPVSGSASLGGGVVMTSAGGLPSQHQMVEEASKKRELRLLKNREAAKECRRKKKEYIKCLENRVAVLENQNKALIEELKSLKELYCQKSD